MEPQSIFVASLSKSFWDLVFTAGWAAVTVFLLLKFSWWVSSASLVVLVLIVAGDAVRVALLIVSLPAVIRASSGGRFHVMAVAVQATEVLAGAALCVWVYTHLFV
jgi:hypothetical protein